MSTLKIYPLQEIEALLGFAAKAGKITAGNNATKDKLKKGKVQLVILAEDASRELLDYYFSIKEKHGTQVIRSGEKKTLGLAIGKSQRGVIGITDKQFAESILTKIREKDEQDKIRG